MSYLFSIDQDMANLRAIRFDHSLPPLTVAQRELAQSFPGDAGGRHDADATASARELLNAGWQVAVERVKRARSSTILWLCHLAASRLRHRPLRGISTTP
ncbi:hypothetical protein ACOJCM_17955 [Billgrantia sp. LNSP4103-1]|uniref:hypothetical protein n=1 Tax=Billgrantia sp. LNSP4103-1 TaxID=3410266 RepID=UPI00403F198A